MEESILNSIKIKLGVEPDDEAFDVDLVIDINTELFILYQMGLGKESFTITGPQETWRDFLGSFPDLESVKSLVALRVREFFDPSQGAVATTREKLITELEHRIFWVLNSDAYSNYLNN